MAPWLEKSTVIGPRSAQRHLGSPQKEMAPTLPNQDGDERRDPFMNRVITAAIALVFVAPMTPVHGGVRYRDPVFTELAIHTHPFATVVNASGKQVVLSLDVYEPVDDASTGRPALVLAHGGGFTAGDRTDAGIVGLATAFAARGYVATSISYRIRPPGTPGSPTMQDLIVGSLAGQLPAAMHDAQHDMQAAVRWMRENATSLRIDPDLIAAGGISAGASMALEAAYNPEDDADPGATPSSVGAAVSISGATDPRRIEPGRPPTAMFNGTNDSTAPYPTAIAACGTASAMLNVCELTTYPGSGHDLSAQMPTIIPAAADFLCRYLVPSC